MSNKNLKVYKMQFVTEVKKLYLSIKFPCSIKLNWKRSESLAESTLVPLEAGVANFDQVLKLNVKMYFDTVLNKFVQKKSLYSFIIVTEKGQKSAGSVSIDLAEFFNKRIYELNQSFPLDKCPVPNAKVQMNVTYLQGEVQQGYDSMSCISATNPMDSSMVSVDLNDLNPNNKSQLDLEQQAQRSSTSDNTASDRGKSSKVDYLYQKLEASDVIQSEPKGERNINPSNISENIKNLKNLTDKINFFVNDKSKNIRFQIQNYRRKIQNLQESHTTLKLNLQQLETDISEQKKRSNQLQRDYANYKFEMQQKMSIQLNRSKELESKCSNSQRIISNIQAKMNQSGSSQNEYLQELKSNYESSQNKLRQEIEDLHAKLLVEQKAKAELNSQLSQAVDSVFTLKVKLQVQTQKTNHLQDLLSQKQSQLQGVRINLQKTFQNLVASLNSVY